MSDLRLVEPSIEYKEQYLDMIQEWKLTGERMVPFTLRIDCSDFDSFLNELHKLRYEPIENERMVNSTTYWLVNSKCRVLGAVNIRHKLNKNLLNIGGHIGYGIRPSERQKGYATKQLTLALIKAKEMGIRKALVTCDKGNVGSAKTILNNGGILDSEALIDGKWIQRYWIEIR